ncbi:hypothetical protein CO674_34255 [Rhizobium hidalgonense]|uniref:Uncharacterized protein n=1 Tax=Rhizobium hidalgonense TaxID=1538159 RepID=A0ABX4JGM9_9HYPH|nr:hypothetical protein CO659_28900 [Rhizobium sp. S9]PDT19208.1 hypothetical protein CO674_34255 [Rhizobium hidalgonense]
MPPAPIIDAHNPRISDEAIEKWEGKPLYTFAGDKKPGDMTGRQQPASAPLPADARCSRSTAFGDSSSEAGTLACRISSRRAAAQSGEAITLTPSAPRSSIPQPMGFYAPAQIV